MKPTNSKMLHSSSSALVSASSSLNYNINCEHESRQNNNVFNDDIIILHNPSSTNLKSHSSNGYKCSNLCSSSSFLNIPISQSFLLLNQFKRFYHALTIALLMLAVLCVCTSPVSGLKLKLCQPTPSWRFYDIASHLANVSIQNSTIPKDLLPDNQYFRSPFEGNNDDHVTLIALISLQDERANTEQWLTNLEHIYQNLVGQKSFKNIRFLLINSKDSYNPAWVNKVRQNVSFEVYQEMNSSPIGTLLDGDSGDVFIFDRCNLLAYYIRFPLTFIDQKDPFFQATILAAHSDSPCKEKCPKKINETLMASERSDLQAKPSSIMATTPIPDFEVTQEEMLVTTSSTLEDELATANAPLINVLSRMGEVLQSFYDRYTMTFQSENESSTELISEGQVEPADIDQPVTEMPNANLTSNLIETLNRTLETYSKNFANVQSPTILATGNATKNETLMASTSGTSSFEQKPSSSTTEGCNKTICSEWTTEKLLAARLCCLSFITDDDEDQVNQYESMINVNASDYVPSNGGFGCKLYARSRCSMIKPVLRCCARKLVNEYFNYAMILQRNEQRKHKSKRVKYGQRPTRSNQQRSSLFVQQPELLLQNLIQQQQQQQRTGNNLRQQRVKRKRASFYF